MVVDQGSRYDIGIVRSVVWILPRPEKLATFKKCCFNLTNFKSSFVDPKWFSLYPVTQFVRSGSPGTLIAGLLRLVKFLKLLG